MLNKFIFILYLNYIYNLLYIIFIIQSLIKVALFITELYKIILYSKKTLNLLFH